ncbi:extracellular solute-binding protein [Haloplanus sp. GCM10025708]|uniref:extracellular solute-binding protein n=1 Tax=Haloplanus sp. GCM10025708 TaxID=3252679 RepID=UPI003624204D
MNEVATDEAAYQETYERMQEEHTNVFKYWGSGAQAIQFLREENAYVAEMWGGRTLALEEAGYDQMEYVIPEEGTFVLDENYNFPKSSEKQDAALDLINWSFQRENAIELTKNLGYPLMIKNPPEAITSLPDYVDSIDSLSWPEWSTALEKQEQMTRDFQKIKQS